MTTIRPARLDDAPAIARVRVETWQSAYRGIVPDDTLDAMSPTDHVETWAENLRQAGQATFVASDTERGVVGFANGGPERESSNPRRGELYVLYVLPEFHGRALGRRLTTAVARWLVDSRFETLIVWVLEDNPACRFYERLGGVLSGRKEIEIGGRTLGEVSYVWENLAPLVADADREEFERAAAYVLEKNAELYRRLGGCLPTQTNE